MKPSFLLAAALALDAFVAGLASAQDAKRSGKVQPPPPTHPPLEPVEITTLPGGTERLDL